MPRIHHILPSGEPTAAPKLTAILVISGAFQGGEKMMRCLAAQTAVGEMELMLATDVADNFDAAAPYLGEFAAVQRIVGDVSHLPHLRAECAMLARAPYIGFCEDHSYVEDSWARELIAAFDSDPHVAAVAPAFVNPNPVHPVSRAQFAAYFARFGRDRWSVGMHPVLGLPWHNTAYRLDVLQSIGSGLGRALEVEGFLQEEIRRARPDSVFLLTARTATHHVNVSRLWPACHHAFVGGRLYATERAERLGWSLGRRWLQVGASPLIPFVRLARDRSLLKAMVRGPLDGMNLWLHALVMALFHAAGEAVGNVASRTDLIPAYSNFECRRSRFVRAADVPLLEP